jgi:hypothetical protein
MHCIQQLKLICIFWCLVVDIHKHMIRDPAIMCTAWSRRGCRWDIVDPQVTFLLPETYLLFPVFFTLQLCSALSLVRDISTRHSVFRTGSVNVFSWLVVFKYHVKIVKITDTSDELSAAFFGVKVTEK